MKEFGDSSIGSALMLCTDKGCYLNTYPGSYPKELKETMALGHEVINNGHEVVLVYYDNSRPLPAADALEVLRLTGIRISEGDLKSGN